MNTVAFAPVMLGTYISNYWAIGKCYSCIYMQRVSATLAEPYSSVALLMESAADILPWLDFVNCGVLLVLELANRSKHIRNKHKIGILGAFNI